MEAQTELLNAAVRHHHRGDLPRAERLYRRVLRVDPGHVDASHLLGVVAHQLGRHEEAVRRLSDVIAAAGSHPAVHCNLGAAFHTLRRYDEAVSHFQVALQHNPDYARAHYNLANSLRAQQKLDEAEQAYRRALLIEPGLAEAHNNLGNVLQDQGCIEQAIACFQAALTRDPDFIEAHYNLGNALRIAGRREDAANAFGRAIALQPAFAEAHNNLGSVRRSQSRWEEALASFETAIRRKPDYAEAENNAATVLQPLGELTESIAGYRRALRLDPLNPDTHSNLLVALNYDPSLDPETLHQEHRAWAAQFEAPAARMTRHANDPDPNRRLRIGYVSADFRAHPVASFVLPLLAHHNTDAFDIVCYSDVMEADEITARAQRHVGCWRDVRNWGTDRLVEQIVEDRIDVLVDLAGHTAGNRLPVFARKPAPVQITYLGYPNTTGLQAMDYRLTDEIADPAGETVHHSESLIRLKGPFCCYEPPADCPPPGSAPASRAGVITFGSLNNLAKLNAHVIDLWSELLHRVPNSRLLIARTALTARAQQRLATEFARRKISGQRLVLQPLSPSFYRHMEVYLDVDVALDTFPWCGHTTTCEALWMGAPTITLRGNRHAGRMSASVLKHLGLQELVARTPEEYVSIAAQLAGDTARISGLRRTLRDHLRESRLCDAAAFTAEFESALRDKWRSWCGPKPEAQPNVLASESHEAVTAHQMPRNETPQLALQDCYDRAAECQTRGDVEEALDAYRDALKIEPNSADVLCNMGAALQSLERLDEAAACYEQALSANISHAAANYNLGVILLHRGRWDDAVVRFGEAVRVDPGLAPAHLHQGIALRRQGRSAEALACFQRAEQAQPGFVDAVREMARTQRDRRQVESAIASYRRLSELCADDAEARFDLGNLLLNRGDWSEAIDAYREAIRIDPGRFRAHHNLGIALRAQHRIAEAIECCRSALRIKPDLAAAHNNLGSLYRDQGRLQSAEDELLEAIRCQPQFAGAHTNLGAVQLAQARPQEAAANFRRAIALRPDFPEAHSNLLMSLNYDSELDTKQVYVEHVQWGEQYPSAPIAKHANIVDPHRRLRIGYVSPDFRRHSVADFLEPILKCHDRNDVEIVCYSQGTAPDETTARFQNLANRWRETCGMSAAEVAQMIRDDRIDILVDLAGHTANNRLDVFALKPAPVQMTYLGYGTTTGLQTIDYRLTDHISDPPGDPVQYTESLVRLPRGHLCFEPPAEAPGLSPVPAERTGIVTFGSFNSLPKLTQPVVALWSRVLRAVPCSRLVLKNRSFRDEATCVRFQHMFGQHGIASDRLLLHGHLPAAEHFALYGEVDVALDPFIYTGPTTACEALWMGVPVITLRGDRYVRRNVASILTTLDLPELIAETPDRYVSLAQRLALDIPALGNLRASLRDRMRKSPLCDGKRFTGGLEDAFRDAWRIWCTDCLETTREGGAGF